MDFLERSRAAAADAAAGGRVSPDEDALRRCDLSKSYLDAGDYEAAREALGALWRGAGARPAVEGLGARAAAEVTLQAGRLTGAIGGTRRMEGAQEAAKNLFTECALVFERLGDAPKVAEARAELGLCYWREGAFDEARAMLRSALEALPDADGERRGATLVRLAVVEFSARRYDEVLELLEQAAPHVESSASDYLKGCFHNHRAVTFRALADSGEDAPMRDRSLVEYAAASYHFEQAGHTRYHAHTENNLAVLFNNIGRHEEAHRHLERARQLFAALKDTASVAQCDDTLARVLTAEGRLEEAERIAASAVRVLQEGDRQALLAEALTTLGVAQARLGNHEEARRSFKRAEETADAAGDRAGAGAASLALAEELGEHLTSGELCEAFARAHDLLGGTRDAATLARLTACARRAVGSLTSPRAEAVDGGAARAQPEERWSGFSLKAEVLRYESELIGRALHDADGIVSRAAKLLGFRHHQTFVALLNNRHKDLLHARTPIVPRRRSLVRARDPRRAD
ncbi:MAG: tetratricopeptide repeat protein [Pyrinomonadaceae bacterium]